ncbi:ATP-binding protein [Streptomyces sp. NPDC046909]|uniref:ATP-binding protein n=1 Tax=Streptomyces sp. NPDC046909 TaxID=3155617 RepID=UPI00340AB297
MALAEEGQKSITVLLEQLDRGEPPSSPDLGPAKAAQVPDDPWHELEAALIGAHEAAWVALVGRKQGELASTLVYLAGGLQNLVVRALSVVTERTEKVSDPDELHTLFDLANLLRRIRRSGSRLAVLGGAQSRTVTRAVPVLDVLRGAAGEIERYARVRIPLPGVTWQVPGVAGPDVIHILSELTENATACSAPETKVFMRVQPVAAGLAVEIEDRGWGLTDAVLHESNRLLADPQASDLAERLRQRRVGLLVVARLARRYNIRVQLSRNITGGTTALVVIPHNLLEQPEDKKLPHRAGPERRAAGVPGPSARAAVHQGAVPQAASGPRPRGGATGSSIPAGSGRAPVPGAVDRAPIPAARRPAAALGTSPDARPVLPRRPTQQPSRHGGGADETAAAPSAPPQADFVSNITGATRQAEEDWQIDVPSPHVPGAPNGPAGQ